MYKIPAYNLPALKSKIDELNRRAIRLGCDPITLTVVREFEEQRKRTNPRMTYMLPMVEVAIEGESPKLNGWRLVAAIERLETDENLVRTVPGQTLPESYRTTDLHCDHCGANRTRREVFVLGHDDGRFAQVGRQCIADFLGHVSTDTLVSRASWEFDLDAACRDAEDEHFEGFGGGLRRVIITEFVTAVAICVRRLGWISRKAADAWEAAGGPPRMTTASLAWDVCTRSREHLMKAFIEENNLETEERDETLAAGAIAWARSIPTTGVSDYEYNLGAACRQDSLTYKTMGIVASVVSAYLRHLDREEELGIERKKNVTRQHVGTVGERLGFPQVTIKRLKYFESDYGLRTLVRFEDQAGNVLIWWASKELEWKEGDVLDITGTVKKHGDYNGCPQTELQRVAEGLPKPKRLRAAVNSTLS